MSRELPHSVRIGDRRTSIRLDDEIWRALQEICAHERVTMSELCTRVDATRGQRSLVSALRVYAVLYFRRAAERSGIERGAADSGGARLGARP